MEAMAARGVRLVMGDVFTNIEKREASIVGTTRSGEVLMADQILFAIGRSPNTRALGLETAGVKLDAVGAVVVDAFSQSNVPSIFAVGDVTNRVNLTPVAIREGHAFADTQFGGKPWSTSYENIPTAVFTTPEIGTVGLSEEAARACTAQVDVYETRFRPMRNVLAGRDERTHMKLVVDGTTRPGARRARAGAGCGGDGADGGDRAQSEAPPRPTSTAPWPCIRARQKNSSPCARSAERLLRGANPRQAGARKGEEATHGPPAGTRSRW